MSKRVSNRKGCPSGNRSGGRYRMKHFRSYKKEGDYIRDRIAAGETDLGMKRVMGKIQKTKTYQAMSGVAGKMLSALNRVRRT